MSWSPPLLANGIILFYNVEYWNATHSLNQTTHVPYVILSNLRKYAHYRISVQAATQVGLGNHTSEILNITTLEDGECLVLNKGTLWCLIKLISLLRFSLHGEFIRIWLKMQKVLRSHLNISSFYRFSEVCAQEISVLLLLTIFISSTGHF